MIFYQKMKLIPTDLGSPDHRKKVFVKYLLNFPPQTTSSLCHVTLPQILLTFGIRELQLMLFSLRER